MLESVAPCVFVARRQARLRLCWTHATLLPHFLSHFSHTFRVTDRGVQSLSTLTGLQRLSLKVRTSQCGACLGHALRS